MKTMFSIQDIGDYMKIKQTEAIALLVNARQIQGDGFEFVIIPEYKDFFWEVNDFIFSRNANFSHLFENLNERFDAGESCYIITIDKLCQLLVRGIGLGHDIIELQRQTDHHLHRPLDINHYDQVDKFFKNGEIRLSRDGDLTNVTQIDLADYFKLRLRSEIPDPTRFKSAINFDELISGIRLLSLSKGGAKFAKDLISQHFQGEYKNKHIMYAYERSLNGKKNDHPVNNIVNQVLPYLLEKKILYVHEIHLIKNEAVKCAVEDLMLYWGGNSFLDGMLKHCMNVKNRQQELSVNLNINNIKVNNEQDTYEKITKANRQKLH